ncbi:MAG: hypothetical protein PHX70_05240 [Clostridium sp.]|nr:hypothetical protein [Clostridium sp.]
MDSNSEFLNYIYQNAEMGKNSINQLIGTVKDTPLKKELESQLREYNEIFDMANIKIDKTKKDSKSVGTITKVTTYLMINLNTLTNKTPSHIAEMMIKGSTMGIVDVTKKLKEYKEADADISALGNRLLKLEQQNVDEMKKFLK